MKRHSSYSVSGLAGAVMVSLFFFSQTVVAAGAKYDMYSWQQENTTVWCFSLLPSSKKPVDVATVKGTKDQVCGNLDAKRLMGQVLPEHAKVYWKTDEASGLVLPSRDVVNDLKRFSTTMGFTLNLPKGSPQASKGDSWK